MNCILIVTKDNNALLKLISKLEGFQYTTASDPTPAVDAITAGGGVVGGTRAYLLVDPGNYRYLATINPGDTTKYLNDPDGETFVLKVPDAVALTATEEDLMSWGRVDTDVCDSTPEPRKSSRPKITLLTAETLPLNVWVRKRRNVRDGDDSFRQIQAVTVVAEDCVDTEEDRMTWAELYSAYEFTVSGRTWYECSGAGLAAAETEGYPEATGPGGQLVDDDGDDPDTYDVDDTDDMADESPSPAEAVDVLDALLEALRAGYRPPEGPGRGRDTCPQSPMPQPMAPQQPMMPSLPQLQFPQFPAPMPVWCGSAAGSGGGGRRGQHGGRQSL